MDLQKLQDNWESQFDIKGNEENLVLQLFRESRQNKVKSRLNYLVVYNILFMVYNLTVIILSWNYIAQSLPNPGYWIPGSLLIILSLIAFYMNVFQLNDVLNIKFDQPIVELQKTISKLKVKRIKHNRYIFIFSNIYFWLMIMMIFSLDLFALITTVWENAALVIIFHTLFSIIWFPIAFWLLNKYDMPDENSKFWAKLKKDSYLTDQSVNFSLNKTLGFLQEIESFEKE